MYLLFKMNELEEYIDNLIQQDDEQLMDVDLNCFENIVNDKNNEENEENEDNQNNKKDKKIIHKRVGKKQFSKMSKKQKEEQMKFRLEKNRLSAKQCRIKKKKKFQMLEEKVRIYKEELDRKNREIYILKLENANFRKVLSLIMNNQTNVKVNLPS